MRKKKRDSEISRQFYWGLNADKKFHIQKITSSNFSREIYLEPRQVGHYALRWIKKGSGTAYIDHIPYPFGPGSFSIGTPKHISWYDVPDNQEIDVFIIAFTEPFLAIMNFPDDASGMLHHIANTLFIRPTPVQAGFIERFTGIIHDLSHSSTDLSDQFFAALIKSLILYLINIKKEHSESLKKGQGNINIYRQFLDRLNENFASMHQVSEYSGMMNITQKKLNRVCQALTRSSAREVIHARIDYEAKRTLFYANDSVKEIGRDLGFADSTHFIRFFRNINGITPAEMRKIMHKPRE